jgi:LPS-assembly lipoprotein
MSLSRIFSIALSACLLSGMALSGCGFQPLYGSGGTGEVPRAFASIDIAPLKNREGQFLHNELRRLIQPNGRAGPTRYRLVTTISESKTNLAVKKSAFATRANLKITARFSLFDGRSLQSVLSATSSSTSGYNIFSSEFQTLMAAKSARENALRKVAQEIRAILGAHFKRPRAGQTG